MHQGILDVNGHLSMQTGMYCSVIEMSGTGSQGDRKSWVYCFSACSPFLSFPGQVAARLTPSRFL